MWPRRASLLKFDRCVALWSPVSVHGIAMRTHVPCERPHVRDCPPLDASRSRWPANVVCEDAQMKADSGCFSFLLVLVHLRTAMEKNVRCMPCSLLVTGNLKK